MYKKNSSDNFLQIHILFLFSHLTNDFKNNLEHFYFLTVYIFDRDLKTRFFD